MATSPTSSACGASRRSRGAYGATSARCARAPRRRWRRLFLPECRKIAGGGAVSVLGEGRHSSQWAVTDGQLGRHNVAWRLNSWR